MLSVCSATTACSTHSKISFHGGLRFISSCGTPTDVRCNIVDVSNRAHLHGVCSLGKLPAKISSFNFMEHSDCSGFMDTAKQSSFQNELDYQTGRMGKPFSIGTRDIQFVQSPGASPNKEDLMVFINQLIDDTDIPAESASTDSILTMDVIKDDNSLPSDTLINVSLPSDTETLSSVKSSIQDVVAETNKSINDIVNKGENALNSSLDAVLSSIKSAFKEASETVDNFTAELISAANRTGQLAGNKLSAGVKEASGQLEIAAADGLRRTIVTVEDSLVKGLNSAASAYGSLKKLLPSDIQNTLDASEEKFAEFSKPVGSVFHQGYSSLQDLERNLGLDPNDPIIPFLLFLGASATLWGWYWILNYSGYLGDLSAKSALELLIGKEDAALIDVRSEDLRQRDGVPDLRRSARYRYASVTSPEVDSNLRKLLLGGRNLDDSLIAGVIHNLKIVQDGSKVIVMDGNGARSKGIAREMRKLGVKNSYLVQGGFQSWVREGLRVKELRPETALTILNEDAEAIIEDFNPTPLRLLTYGLGVIAVSYGAIEWETTLQFIGVIGLALSVYGRVVSYEDVEDFKQDVRLLVAPVRWAAGKFQTIRDGLPTSPSSSDVQSRVLQAAAKHESQPSDGEKTGDSSPGLTATNE